MPLQTIKCLALCLCLSFVVNSYAQKYTGEFAEPEFNCSRGQLGFFAHMFETKKQLLDFMDLRKGEAVAEIGAAEGYNLGMLSVVTDSITFYAEDIDAKSLKERKYKKEIRRYSRLRKTKQTNQFKLVIGTIHASNLPDGQLDKVVIIDSYHDFDNKDEMLDDISRKLKPGGKLLILDGFSFPGDTQTCRACGVHVLTTLEVELKRMEQHGFYLTHMKAPDFKAFHYGNALVLEKDKNKSDAFYKSRYAVAPLVQQAFNLKKPEIAADSQTVQKITQALLPSIREITTVYAEYELWVKDLAQEYLRQANYPAAINLFKANTLLYPISYQAYYWLGVAYQENKQPVLASLYLNRALSLQPDNDICTKRLQQLKQLTPR
jgi:ubiquinone/menaquinone biosynthesis C-methylase UbiE